MSEPHEEPDLTALRERAHRRMRRLLWILPATTVVAATLVVLTAPWIDRHFHEHPRHQLPWWGKVLFVVGAVLVACGEWAVIALIRRRFTGNWYPEPAQVLGADRRVRKRVGRALRSGRLPEDPTERALALNQAERIRSISRYLIPLVLAAAVLQLSGVLLEHRPTVRAAMALAAGCLMATAVLWLYLRHKAIRLVSRRHSR